MEKWKFPHGEDLTPTGANNTAIEIFLDTIADSLTREVIQNSLDAHNPNVNNPVIVEFTFYEIDSSKVPGINQIKDFALPRSFKMWEEINNEDTIKFLSSFSDVLNKSTVKVLKISDYNTRGLNDKNYKSLVLGNAYSEKDDDNSGGSKGIGKAAPFAASDLRMVFYNTVPTEDAPKSAGVMNFVSFEHDQDGKQITQERATYFEEGKKFISKQIESKFGKRKPDEYGTDLFILGLKQFEENWSDKILLSVVNNFLISVMNNELEVIVDGDKLNSTNLNEKMAHLEELKLKREEKIVFSSTLNYYDVMTNPETLKFNLDDRFKGYSFYEDEEDATLYLLQHDPANRTILQTRKAGMKIYDRNRISGNINFSGVFQATGNKLNAFLKDMENANHNTWSIDRLSGNSRKEAECLLTDLLQWYKEKVKESYEVSGENEIDAFGVNDLLPLNENKESEYNTVKDSGIKNKIENISIKKKTPKPEINSDDGDKEGDFLDRDLEEAGISDGEGSGFGGGNGGKGGGNDTPTSGGTEKGNKGEDSEGDENNIEKEKRISASDSVSFKIIGLNPNEGQYRIVGKAHKKMKSTDIAFKYVGADGKTYSIKILSASSKNHPVTLNRNALRLNKVSKGDRLSIDFTVDSKLRMKMEGTVYEIKG